MIADIGRDLSANAQWQELEYGHRPDRNYIYRLERRLYLVVRWKEMEDFKSSLTSQVYNECSEHILNASIWMTKLYYY